jgi:hypothetical protein
LHRRIDFAALPPSRSDTYRRSTEIQALTARIEGSYEAVSKPSVAPLTPRLSDECGSQGRRRFKAHERKAATPLQHSGSTGVGQIKHTYRAPSYGVAIERDYLSAQRVPIAFRRIANS